MAKWALVRAEFPGVSESSFWRAIKNFKNGAAGATGRVSKKATQRVIREVHRAKDLMPMPLAPGTVIQNGVENVSQTIDYLVHLNEALRAADLLRDAALVTGEDGKAKIKSTKTLMQSARIRLDAIKASASVMEFLADVNRLEAFFKAVTEAVGQVSPEAQQEILDRMAELNRAYGMTTAAFL
jgi:hypothetical protein